MDWDAVKREWLNPNSENVYFPLPLLALLGFVTVLWIRIAGGAGHLAIVAILYGVWCGAVAVLLWIGSHILRRIERAGWNTTRRNLVGAAIEVAVLYLGYRAALVLAEVGDALM